MPRFTYHGLDDKSHILDIEIWQNKNFVGQIQIHKGQILPEGDFADPHSECWQVSSVEVSEKFRRQGYATKLYQEAARIAASNGVALCSDTAGALSQKAEAFWHKQTVKGRAYWEVPGPPEKEGWNFDYGRYVLQYPPPASLE